MPSWRADSLMIFCDMFFNYAIESLKSIQNSTIGYELSLKFAEPASFDSHKLILAGLLCILVAWLTDSYLGKFYITVIGVFAATASCICFYISVYDLNATKDVLGELTLASILLMYIYMATSNIRNNLILDQIDIENNFHEIRKKIFYLVFFKILGRSLFILLTSSDQEIHYSGRPRKIIINISSFLIACYLVLILILWHVIYYGSPSLRIWEKSFHCVIIAFLYRRRASKSSSELHVVESQPFGGEQTLEPIKKKSISPLETKDKVDRSTKEKPTDNQFTKSGPTPSLSKKNRKHWAHQTTPFSPVKQAHSKKQTRYLGPFAMSLVKKKESIDDITDIYSKHWLNKSKPNCSDFIIHQTREFLNIVAVLAPGISFGLLMYFLMLSTFQQADLFRRPYPNFFFESIDVSLYFTLLELLLFPLVEYLLFRAFASIRSDLYYILIGYILLVVSVLIMLILQLYVEYFVQYLPVPFVGQCRIFNGLPSKSQINSLTDKKVIIEPYEYHLFKDIQMSDFSNTWYINVRNDRYNFSISSKLLLFQKRTVSYMVTEEGLTRVSLVDPTIYTKPDLRSDYLSHFFLVSEMVVLTDSIELIPIDKGTNQKVNLGQRGIARSIKPGDYRLIYHGEQQFNLSYPIAMVAGGMYALFLYNASGRMDGEMFLVEGPVPLIFEILFIQIFIACFAQAVATVSYFKFLYLESPSNLKCTLFNIMFVCEFFGVAYFNTENFKTLSMRQSRIMLINIIFGAVVTCITILLISKFRFKYDSR